ncbi:GFA family protein [Aliivibrio sifiae]|uniref:GFA family protein n=1 Tax=Aliivibrio fischeri TaxID=668 RepID=UPI0012DA5D34|nr:GFA family protein [Aliivibrio fischeri]MUJ27929.1 hypothetical protein [Aliivibrio fischeri]
MSLIKGSCHCGSVAWEFDLPTKTVVKCYCSMCRKLQGTDHSTYVVVPKEQFILTKGKELSVCYQATKQSYKNFCSECGTPTHLVNGKHFPDDVMLPLGVVENYMEKLAPKIQVYTADKPSWVNIHDDEPIFS